VSLGNALLIVKYESGVSLRKWHVVVDSHGWDGTAKDLEEKCICPCFNEILMPHILSCQDHVIYKKELQKIS
jgi:hypothetical protein